MRKVLQLICQKQHVAVSVHVVREAVAAGIISPYWLKGKWNISDIMTKQIPITEFKNHCKFLFWLPKFHLLEHNKLDDPDVYDQLQMLHSDSFCCLFERRCSAQSS